MAGLATLRETAVMWIAVAIRALAKQNSGVARLIIGICRMALRARDLSMVAGQGITSFRMVELRLTGLIDADRFPVFEVMALLACLPKAAAVRVLMASRACRGQAQIGLTQVFDFYGRSLLRANVRRSMTTAAI